jgi:PadR family transcriptional regulator, regulatory protein AphA
MSSEIRLTPTSYIVLGLIEWSGEATPYDLKQTVGAGLGNFWSLQHAQLYSEPERLAAAGYLQERREDSGRRRKHYAITDKGREALRLWVAETTEKLTEPRDLALLKVFFGADPGTMAAVQAPAHERKLAEYEELKSNVGHELPPGPRIALEAGIEIERNWAQFWARLAEET